MMRTLNTKVYLVLLIVLCVCGLTWYATTQSAQTLSLEQRIAKLKAEVNTVPLSAQNYPDRAQTLRDWGNMLTDRGHFLTQQDLQLSFTRLPDANAQAEDVMKQWVRTLSFIEQNGGRMGTLVRTDRNQLQAGQLATIVLEYTVGAVEVPKGTGIRLGVNMFNIRPRPQTSDPASENFASFKVISSTAQTEATSAPVYGIFGSIFGPIPLPALRVTSGALKQGDKVIITLGDTSRGSPGYRLQARDTDDFPFLIAADFTGDGNTLIPAAKVSMTVAGDAAALINAIVPSVVAVNEPFSVRLRVEDQYWNPAKFDGGRFKVSLNGKPLGEISVAAGKYTAQLDGVKIPLEGGYKIDVASIDGRFACKSNPMLVERNPQQRIYWGELHGHSGWEEGVGTVPRYYEFARDVAYLDFASLTGHDLFLSKKGWDEIRSETEKANRSGQFVAYMGYEWTQQFINGGHHNVFFKTDKGNYVTRWEAPKPNLLYEKLRAIDATDNVLIIPHAHEPGDWNYNDSEMERLVEIFSMHGSFEYFGQRYLRRGYRMGFVAASDDHTGHPGYSPAMISTRNGLAAVYSDKLDRDGIWRGMKQRATYATSNALRPVVRMSVDDKRVGEAVSTGVIPTLKARVLGTAAIDHIDVIHNGQVEYRRDYLTPRPADPTAVQVMFFTPTETGGDTVASPKGGWGWEGWIEVTGGKIASIEPLNVDHYTDQFHRVDDQHIWFSCRTRGDFDGVLIRLAQSPADTQIRVIVSNLVGAAGGTGASGNPTWAVSIPGRKPLHEMTFKLSDVAQKQGEYKLTPTHTVFARKARANAEWDVSFSYRPTKAPVQDDYYYLRVVQIDGEAAWVSPVWIGEQKKK
ncbi:MAG: DUF3604 domain-containing protein [Acidobacteria bacterium]|nr:DUF3604 domain-containing protein [Acidobacteriota bacterium]